MSNPPLIRASELAHYGFCRRAWWLANIKKLPASNQAVRRRGTRHHQRHARQVQAALRWRQAGLFLLSGGLLLVILSWLWLF